jgi:hypothetical protein
VNAVEDDPNGCRDAEEVLRPIQAVRLNYSLARLLKEHKALKLPHDEAWLSFANLPSEID